jgi:LPXTG-motif cell wall-anchored protein
VGAAARALNDGDVVRWQFTLIGYGADLNADNAAWGASSLKALADKDALTWRVAEINAADSRDNYGAAYTNALAVLTKHDSTQQEADDALAALGGDDRPDPVNPGGDTNPGDGGNNGPRPPANTNYRDALADVLANLTDTVKTPEYGSVGGEWAVLALARGNAVVPAEYYEDYLARIIRLVRENDGVLPDSRAKKTEYSRLILALTSLGVDVANVGGYNLLAPLGNFNDVIYQGINGPIFALIALDTNGYEIPSIEDGAKQNTRQKMIEYILSKEISGGGFALTGSVPDPDITAMALQALVPYRDEPAVKAAINRALVVLSNIQLDSGGYQSWGTTNVESVAQVIVALTALGFDPAADPRFVKAGGNPITALLAYQQTDGSFVHTNGMDGVDQMSTEQAAYALVAYDRFVTRKNRLYDMTDVNAATKPGDPGAAKGASLTDENGTGITVTADAGVLPGGNVELWVDPIASGNTYDKAKAALKGKAEKFTLYDIFLLKNNEEIQPDGSITLSVPVPNGYDGAKCRVYRVEADGSMTDMNAVFRDGRLVFNTDHLSLYAVAQAVNDGGSGNPKTGDNAHTVLLSWLGAISLLGVLVLSRRKKQTNS